MDFEAHPDIDHVAKLVVWIWGLNCKWTFVQVLCTWWPRTLSLTQCPGYWTTVQLLLLYNLKF